MENIETYLRTEMEMLQYVFFFGALLLFGLMEQAIRLSSTNQHRIRRWPLNFGITALNVLLISVIPISGLFIADYALDNDMGLLNSLGLSTIPVLILGLLLRSLISWLTHWAMHKMPFLWRVHRVHHTDTHLDISTTVRFHPLEFLINIPVLLLSILLLGISPIAIIIYELFDVLMAVFTHANIKLPRPLERVIRFVFVTPQMHRVHHSSWQPETDSNYGATLSIWDHLFGTYRDKSYERLSTMQLGLAEYQDSRSLSLWGLLKLPFSVADNLEPTGEKKTSDVELSCETGRVKKHAVK